MRKAILFLAAMLLLPFPASAQEQPQQQAAAAPRVLKAAGIVRTGGKVPVAGATVRVVHLETGRGWLSWTDEAGRFELSGIPAGKYRIEAEMLGFQAGAREVELKGGEGAEIELILKVIGEAPKIAPAVAKQEPAPSSAPQQVGPAQQQTRAQQPAQTPAQPGQPPQQRASAPPVAPGAARPGQPPRPGQPITQQQMADLLRERTGQGGFQQVEANTQAQGQEFSAVSNNLGGNAGALESNALGEASSSDAFLLSGSVGRGATAGMQGFDPSMLAMMMGLMGGMAGGFPGGGDFMAGLGGMGGPGGGGFPGGAPGGPGGAQVFVIGPGGGPGGPGGQQAGRGGQQGQQRPGQQRQGQQQAQRGGQQGEMRVEMQGGAFGAGAEALFGMQRLLRQAANRVRFGFFNRYGSSVWDARPYALTGAAQPKIASYRETLGMNLGGPLYIPHVYNGRDKTFFFINYDFSINRNPVDTFATVPSTAERNGDFCAQGAQLFDPLSNLTGPRASFGCQIPPGRINSASAGLLQFIPLPNLPGTAQNFHLQTRVPGTSHRFNSRVLHTINQKLNLQITYGFNKTSSQSVPTFPTLRGFQDGFGQNASIGLTQQWSSRLINDTRLNWSRQVNDSLNRFAYTNDIAGSLGITGISTDPVNFGVPFINFSNFSDLNDPVPSFRRNQTFILMDNFTWTHRKHTLRWGAQVRRQQLNTVSDPMARGQYTFTGLMSSDLDAQGRPVAGTGNDFADFLLGLPQATTARYGSSRTYLRGWAFSGYLQDDWRIHPRFSLTLGARYELTKPFTELYDRLANLEMDQAITQVAVVLPGQTSPFEGKRPRSLIESDYKNIAPRLGIAWRPKLKHNWPRNFIVRAGYGMYFNPGVYNQLAAAMANQPPHAFSQQRFTDSVNLLTLQNGFPAVPPGAVSNTWGVDPHYRIGYAQLWNLSLEGEVKRNISLTATYTGTKGTHLDLLRSPNRAVPTDPLSTELTRRIPNAPGFSFDTFGASSIYHALQLRAQRRFNRGFMLMGQYSFGKSLDNASSIGGGPQVVVQDDTNFDAERGRSTFDIRHQFTSFFIWELPFGERRRWARQGRAASIFGNFSLNGNVTWRSGNPFTVRLLGSAANNSGTGNNFSERPDIIGDPNDFSHRSTQQWFNTSVFVQPPPGRFGNAGRNIVDGPGTVLVNLSLGKNIRLGRDGQRRLDIRMDVQNLFNHPNFSGLNTQFSPNSPNPNFGRITGTRQMRTMDLSLRFNF
jgi:hypothetical protein